MLVCAPFHSIANAPVGMPYLSSWLEARGFACPMRDLNIEARAFLLDAATSEGERAMVHECFTMARRTYLGEAMIWSWLHPEGEAGVVAQVAGSTSPLVREFWCDVGIERLETDSELRSVSTRLRAWLSDRAEELCASASGWIGLSTVITNLPATLFLARAIRRIAPQMLIVIGGPHVSSRSAGPLLAGFPELDAAIPMPAFVPLESLLTASLRAKRGPVPRGVWRRRRARAGAWGPHDESIEHDDGRCEVSLDNLPYANWQALDMSRYESGFVLSSESRSVSTWYPTIPLQTSRGCSYSRCTFCHNVTDYPKYRMQSPARVAAELRHQIDTVGSRGFFFTDDEFCGSRRRSLEIAEHLRDLDEDVRFFCWLRLDSVDEELLDHLYAAGARQLFIGMEAVDDELLELMKKGYGHREALARLRVLHEFGSRHPDFIYTFNLIIDYPGETLECVLRTLETVIAHPHLFVNHLSACCVFHLYEGTPAFELFGSRAHGCLDPLLPPDIELPSFRYLLPQNDPETWSARREIWRAIGEVARFKGPRPSSNDRNIIALYD